MTIPPKLSILAIEDDPDFAATLKVLLRKKLAVDIVVAGDLASARAALRAADFDLITLDLELPDGEGLGLFEQSKADIGLTPVIVVTGNGDEMMAARAFEAGASGYVVKDNRLGSMLPQAIEGALDHRIVQKSLKASEIRYRRLFEAAKDGILILDAQTGVITDANPFLNDLLGYTSEEMLGKNLWEIGPFKDIAESKELFATLQDKEYVRYEHLPLQAKGGRVVDVEFVSNVYSADHTKVIQCNVRDITARKKKQDKATGEYLTLNGIIESTDNPIFSVDTDYRYTSFNRAHAAVMKALYGADIEIGKSLLEYHSVEADKALAKSNLDEAMTGRRVRVEDSAGDHRLSRSHFKIMHNPIKDDDGQAIGVAVFAEDLTEQKKAGAALQQSEEMLRTIFDAVPGLLFVKDNDNMLMRANKALCDAVGVSEEALVGRPLSQVFPDHSEQYWSDDLQVIESGSPKLGILEPLETAQGTRWVRTDKLPYRNADSEIVGVIGFSIDVTESQVYLQDLERINVELDGYAHSVSHDLRGPMASIGMLLLIIRELLEGPQSEEVKAEILEATRMMGTSLEKSDGLIGGLLKLAEAGQSPEHAVSIGVGEMVQRIAEERVSQIEEPGITIDFDEDLGKVLADYSHIYQIFANLIGNAVEHGHSDSLSIEVRRLGDEAEGGHSYLVRDNGSGISPEYIDGIFEPFFKGEPGGSGIGLSTVKKIVEVYGGEIRAYNDGGACFEFTLYDFEE